MREMCFFNVLKKNKNLQKYKHFRSFFRFRLRFKKFQVKMLIQIQMKYVLVRNPHLNPANMFFYDHIIKTFL